MLKNNKNTKSIIVLAILLLCLCSFSGCNYINSNDKKSNEDNKIEQFERPVKSMIDGVSEGSSKKFLEAFPEKISNYLSDIYTDEYMEYVLEKIKEEYGSDAGMSYTVINKTEINDEDIKKLQSDLKQYFDYEPEITKGYELEIELTTKGDKAQDTQKDILNVYEIDGTWYFLDL